MYKINSSPKTYINKQVVKNLASAGQTVNLYAIWSGEYSCSTGTLTYDSSYGASSGGYICVTSGSSSSSCSYYSSCSGGYRSIGTYTSTTDFTGIIVSNYSYETCTFSGSYKDGQKVYNCEQFVCNNSICGSYNYSYYCPSGWSTYSGSGSSLKCYKAATAS